MSPKPTNSPAEVPEPVVAALDRWLAIHDDCAPGLIEGLYVVGSVALGDWRSGTSDIDIVAVTADPADGETAGTLATAFAMVRGELPDLAIDGPYIAWGDLSVAPTTGLHRPWTGDGVWHVDGDCFEINPVTWRTLRTTAVRVRGSRLDTVGVYDDDTDLQQFLATNLRTYWRSVHRDLLDVIGQMDSDTVLRAAEVEWCVLGPARIHVTLETGEIVSKATAARRLIPRVTDEAAVGLQIALDCRDGRLTTVSRSDAVLAAVAMGMILDDALTLA